MYTISYGGTALSDFHVYMADCNKHDGPKRDITSSKIPGRSGELTLDNGRYENFDYTIDAYVKENSMSNLDSLKQYLLSESGYRRLEDSMHPGTFLLARYTGPFTVKKSDRAGAAVSLKFDCMPQRFLASGETAANVTVSGTTITNPTLFPAKPLLRVYGTGTANIGDGTIIILSHSYSYIDIDCDSMEAFRGGTNCNSLIRLPDYEFPSLHPGDNLISWSGSITKIEITPRWWTV